jgi:hypothetical protein
MLTVTFSEAIDVSSGAFQASSIDITGGTVPLLSTPVVTTDASTGSQSWVFTVLPVTASGGTIEASVAAGVVSDTAGNSNTAQSVSVHIMLFVSYL